MRRSHSLIVIAALLGLVASFLATPTVGIAQPGTADERAREACLADLKAQRDAVAAIIQRLQTSSRNGAGGLDPEAINNLLAFRNSFRITIRRNDLGDAVENVAVGTGTSVLASVFLGGPPGWAAATLGAALGAGYTSARNTLGNISDWGTINANTAFYQFLLDYAEYGRVGRVDDDLAAFATRNGNVLQALAGAAPPAAPGALSLYLQAHSIPLLLYFGVYEESLGAPAFPRFKFPQTQGRFGPSRLDVGYYRPVLGAKLADELRQLDREIELLAQYCAGTGPTIAAPSACAGPPAATFPDQARVWGFQAETSTCLCDVAKPEGEIWGSSLYTDDSNICKAAVHAGVVRPTVRPEGIRYYGLVEMRRAGGCPGYTADTRNGVTSNSYGDWPHSFYFPAVQRGLCDERSVPPMGAWYCPAVLPGDTQRISCYCAPREMLAGSVWGTGVYTDDSSICRAARHAGRVNAGGGMVRVSRLPGRASYDGTTARGIETSDYGSWPRSIGFTSP